MHYGFSAILNWINRMKYVKKFATIEVKWFRPSVKYPQASNPLNELIFSISCDFSSKGITDEREMASLSSWRFPVTKVIYIRSAIMIFLCMRNPSSDVVSTTGVYIWEYDMTKKTETFTVCSIEFCFSFLSNIFLKPRRITVWLDYESNPNI